MASEDLQTRVLKKFDRAMPQWTKMTVLRSAFLATGTAGLTSREYVGIDEDAAKGISGLVAVDVDIANIPGTVVGGGLIISPTAITNATIASADGTGGRLFFPIPPIHGGATDTNGSSVSRLYVLPSPISFTAVQNTAYCYLVANTVGATPIAATITLYQDRSDYTFPVMVAAALAEQADV